MDDRVFDFLRTLPEVLRDVLHLETVIRAASGVLPFSEQGFGWVCPALAGLLIGLGVHMVYSLRSRESTER